MPKRHVYSKDTHGFGDFVYVDLLPEVRRSRQFNVNVIVALLYGIVLAFFLVYRPYSSAVFDLEDLYSKNYDLEHELALTQEEFEGYRIDLEAIEFDQDIEAAESIQVNLNNLLVTVDNRIQENDGELKSVNYNADEQQLVVTVEFANNTFKVESLNTAFKGLTDWGVITSTVEKDAQAGEVYVYTIGVDFSAE